MNNVEEKLARAVRQGAARRAVCADHTIFDELTNVRIPMKTLPQKNPLAMIVGSALLSLCMFSSVAHANLIVNGGFETSSSMTITPTGWTQIGHSEGVLPYSFPTFTLPAYEGNNFYDFGGAGDPSGPIGDGIQQTVATTLGTSYLLTFGLSSENGSGSSTLRVDIGGAFTDFLLGSTGGGFNKGLTTQTINYIATGSSTTVSFIEVGNVGQGANDPLIDGVVFEATGPSVGPAPVPEPATLTLLSLGIAGLGMMRRKKVSS